MWLYFLGLFVHFVFLLSVSDIFFQNYITTDEWNCKKESGVAKRLVFILADGLDEEQLISKASDTVADALNGYGTWGNIIYDNINSQYIDNQALVSGFKVDPFTAYFSRFLIDPEPLDNFMNRSNGVFYFGNQDIYNSFYKDELKPWWTFFYPEWERSLISNISFSELGNTTINEVKNLFFSSFSNHTLRDNLNKNKTSFFIQLSFAARASQIFGYESNYTSSAVDLLFSTINNVVDIIEDYYKWDGKTVFILCSNYKPDDGYRSSDKASIVDIKYPFVSWGAGIARNRRPIEIRQIDLAPLVSALLGLNVPSNSRGFIPPGVVQMTREQLAVAQICNGMQLYNLALDSNSKVPFNYSSEIGSIQYMNKKLELFRANKSYLYLNHVTDALNRFAINKLIFNESIFKNVVWYCTILTLFSWILLISSEILPYRESLDNKSVISFSELKIRMTSRINNFNHSMLLALRRKVTPKPQKGENNVLEETIANETSFEIRSVIPERDNENSEFATSSNLEAVFREGRKAVITWKWLRGLTDILFFIAISAIIVTLFAVNWPPIIIYYLITPVILSWLFTYALIDWVVFAKEYFRSAWKEMIIYALIFASASYLAIEGFDQGPGLAFGIILILQSLVYMKKSSWSVTTTWLICGCCIIVSADKGVWVGSAPLEWGLVISIIALILWNLYATFRLIPKGVDFAVTVALLWQDGMSLGCVLFTDAIHSAGHTTPFALKLLCWVSVLFVFLPAIHRRDLSSLVLNICLALSIPYILLSTSFEPLLFLLLSNFMITWMILEGYCDEGRMKRQLTGEDVRRALLFTFFCFFASSILQNKSSFLSANIYSIRCFTETLYEPIVWGILILKPILIYTMLTVIFLIICLSNGVEIGQGFNLVLLIVQYIGAIMFFQIRQDDDGTLPKKSLEAAVGYFIFNIFVIILISAVLLCKYIYRLPMPRAV